MTLFRIRTYACPGWICGLFLAVAVSACTSSYDKGVPIPDVSEADKGKIKDHFPQYQRSRITQSLHKSGSAALFFDIQGYDGDNASRRLEPLLLAIDEFPENAFAWAQLGLNLHLDRRTGAAIEATSHSLVLASNALPDVPSVRTLRQVAMLNLAQFHLTEGQHSEALVVIRRSQAELTGQNYFQFKEWGVEARALAGLGRTEEAREVVERMKGISDFPANPFAETSRYRLFFSTDNARATVAYHEGVIELADENLDAAQGAFNRAININKNLGEDLDARFQLANVHGARGEYEQALKELEKLAPWVKGNVVRSERVYFNLGNYELQTGEYEKSIGAFSRAINTVDTAVTRFNDQVAKLMDDGAFGDERARKLIERALDGASPIYAEAYNNRGVAFARRISSDGDPRGYLANSAERDFRKALENEDYATPHIAHRNLADLYWQTSHNDPARFADALAEFRKSLELKPTYLYGYFQLYLKASEEIDVDIARSARAFIVLLERIKASPVIARVYDLYLPDLETRVEEVLDKFRDQGGLKEELARAYAGLVG